MERIDQYKHEERYRKWKGNQQEALPGVLPASAAVIRRYLRDMELGLNVSTASKRGPRSYMRLNTLRIRIASITKRLQERFGIKIITDVTEEQIHTLFSEFRSGMIRKTDGAPYAAVSDFIKDFKGFWHWHMVVQHRQGTTVPDITAYLDSRQVKPKWVYLTEEQVSQLCNVGKIRVPCLDEVPAGQRGPQPQ